MSFAIQDGRRLTGISIEAAIDHCLNLRPAAEAACARSMAERYARRACTLIDAWACHRAVQKATTPPLAQILIDSRLERIDNDRTLRSSPLNDWHYRLLLNPHPDGILVRPAMVMVDLYLPIIDQLDAAEDWSFFSGLDGGSQGITEEEWAIRSDAWSMALDANELPTIRIELVSADGLPLTAATLAAAIPDLDSRCRVQAGELLVKQHLEAKARQRMQEDPSLSYEEAYGRKLSESLRELMLVPSWEGKITTEAERIRPLLKPELTLDDLCGGHDMAAIEAMAGKAVMARYPGTPMVETEWRPIASMAAAYARLQEATSKVATVTQREAKADLTRKVVAEYDIRMARRKLGLPQAPAEERSAYIDVMMEELGNGDALSRYRFEVEFGADRRHVRLRTDRPDLYAPIFDAAFPDRTSAAVPPAAIGVELVDRHDRTSLGIDLGLPGALLRLDARAAAVADRLQRPVADILPLLASVIDKDDLRGDVPNQAVSGPAATP